MNQYISITSRAPDETLFRGSKVVPWSGEDYYDKIKEGIKNNKVQRKKSETSIGNH